MDNQSKLDSIAGGAILIMFIGAFILSLSPLGFVLIAVGASVMLLLFLRVFRKGQ